MSGQADRGVSLAASAAPAACDAELCIQSRALQEAICLSRHGARAGLVSQLTGLEKRVVNRLYRQLHGRPSPSGQLPFADTWYLRQDGRMAQAALVWQLSQRFAKSRATPARRLIDVYECYLWLVAEPLLDIMRVAFVPQLLAVQESGRNRPVVSVDSHTLHRGAASAPPAGVAGSICAIAAGIAAHR
jgi:hypothetical protein